KQRKLCCEKILTDNSFAEKYGGLGHINGNQWPHSETKDGGFIDQIKEVIEAIKKRRDSRRLIVSAWNPEDVPSMALPPCHTMFEFYVQEVRLS
ncbi:thymidylate synthase, partial [Enterococcus lactis]|uniref:thymidylate synthase n=1 Tax=Enterococcus lactis TaxID=357441 RepID=UPI0031CD8B83